VASTFHQSRPQDAVALVHLVVVLQVEFESKT